MSPKRRALRDNLSYDHNQTPTNRETNKMNRLTYYVGLQDGPKK